MKAWVDAHHHHHNPHMHDDDDIYENYDEINGDDDNDDGKYENEPLMGLSGSLTDLKVISI